jgi:hypothetical protein
VQAPEASARETEVATNKRRLIELDGRRAGPVDRGESTDLLKVCAIFLVYDRQFILVGCGQVRENTDLPKCTKSATQSYCAGWWDLG